MLMDSCCDVKIPLLGNDLLIGGFGNDIIYGGQGQDQINFFRGDDTIVGGAGGFHVCYNLCNCS